MKPRLFHVLVVGSACITASPSYDATRDDAAMTALTRNWAQSDLALTLCEDVATATATATPDKSCQIENVVRGGGSGTTHSASRGGCAGGCGFTNVAFVTGKVSGGGLAVGTLVRGDIRLGDGYEADPYAFPYSLSLTCVDQTAPCFVTGTLEADGSLHLRVERGPLGATGNPGVDGDLVATGAASCP